MTSSNPAPGPGSALQRVLPLLFLGLTFVLVFTLFPQFFGSPAPQSTDAVPTATVTGAAPAAEPDTSTRTAIWNLVLVHPLESGLRFLAVTLGLGAGAAIILFTIIVKLLLLPLTIQQLRSQKAMQRLQPEIKALQKKHANDKEKLSVETMALYKEYGVNPAAGCFPILLQMPVLFGLYAALNNLSFEPDFQTEFLWIDHLNLPDVIVIGGVTLPFLLPILAAATQWVQQKMMMQPSDDPQQRMQNQMMQFMPLMMLWFGLSFSSGLALYWVTQNVVGIVQQYFATGWGSLFPNRTARYGGLTTKGSSGAATDGRGAAPVEGETRASNSAPDSPRVVRSSRQGSGDSRKQGTERGNKPGRRR
ncbi:MAG TPA: membrane protein insertase YidC [Chloroflexota bacterium]|nr:membrane protein insertase YidC [Chloroflexota bacterium]